MANSTILANNQVWNAGVVNDLVASANYLTELLQNTLDISKLEEGKVELNNQYDSITKIIELISKLNTANASKRGITITALNRSDIPARIEMDKARITQVIMNLVTNAVKFSPQNGKIESFINWEWNSGHCPDKVLVEAVKKEAPHPTLLKLEKITSGTKVSTVI